MANNQKSLFRAYLCWLIGGMFGLHHFYLRRDRQAFICFTTLGGYVLGIFADVFAMPALVREANEHPTFLEDFKKQVRDKRRPPFSLKRFLSSIMTASTWLQLSQAAIPNDEMFGIDWAFLHWLLPVVVSLAVWTVGNVGRQQGSLWLTLAATCAVYPIRFALLDDTHWTSSLVFFSTLVFEIFSKQWLLTPPPKRSFVRRSSTLFVCGLVWMLLIVSYLYCNFQVSDGAGGEIPMHEAITKAMKSEWWAELQVGLNEAWTQVKYNGFSGTWKQIYDQIDTGGDKRAYDALRLTASATQAEITAQFRKLSKENHPDKVKGTDEEKRAAQERFMAISQAYERLSSLKAKRKTRNRKSTDAFSDSITL